MQEEPSNMKAIGHTHTQKPTILTASLVQILHLFPCNCQGNGREKGN